MNWWQRLVAWLTGSEPGTRKEQVEDWITNNGPKLDAMRDRQVARHGRRGHYFQRLKGWARPQDDDEDPDNDITGMPPWANLSIDVWHAPLDGGGTHKGWTLNIFVTEADLTEWKLSIDSQAGSLGWTQIVQIAP